MDYPKTWEHWSADGYLINVQDLGVKGRKGPQPNFASRDAEIRPVFGADACTRERSCEFDVSSDLRQDRPIRSSELRFRVIYLN